MRLAAPCCDLGLGDGVPALGGAAYRWVDAFGCSYRLCRVHYTNLVRVLQQAYGPVRAAPPRGRPFRPRVARRPGGPTATGDELRRARGRAGWSQRRVQQEFGYARSVLSSAERGGRHRVPADVAAWVRRVLDAG